MANQSTFYFAWALSSETTFSGAHMVEDELIFAFELRHDEGQFAELEVDIINPHVGFLAPGRPLWAWFSWNDGTTTWPLFFGRLNAIPDDLFGEVVRIKFVAKPKDYAQIQMALADTLRVLPFYDPLYIDPKKLSDPDTVLEGYSALWHCDRVTHAVTISDIIAGEDGIVEFTPNDVFYDSVRVKIAGAPLLVCEIETELSWVQCVDTGVFEFKTVPGLVGDANLGAGYTALSGFKGAGGGFTATFPSDSQFNVGGTPVQRTESWREVNLKPGPHKDGDLMEEAGSTTIPFYGGTLTKKAEVKVNADPETGQGEEYSIQESYIEDYEEPGKSSPASGGGDGGAAAADDNKDNEVTVKTELEQERTERIVVRVTADVQPVLVEATEDEDNIKEKLSMNARDPVEAGFATPASSIYYSGDRGHLSVEYLLMVCRAHLLAGSRVFETEWECPFNKVVTLSCRKNATIEDQRLPGGGVLGKIVSYKMSGDGDSGEFLGGVTLNSAVGNGGSVEEVEGTPDYVDVGYVADGYQHYTGRFVKATTQDLTFSPFGYVQTGIQIPITADQVLVRHEYNDTGQSAVIQQLLDSGAEMARQYQFPSYGKALDGPPQELLDYSSKMATWEQQLNDALYDNPSWVEVEFKPIQDIKTYIEYTAEVSPLVIPKQVDLAAASSP